MAEFVGADFTRSNKDLIKFTMPSEDGDGEGFEISVLPPTKRGFDAIRQLGDLVDKWQDGELEADDFDIGKTYVAVAEAMSHNLQMRRITPEYLEAVGFDISDISDFVYNYLSFLMLVVEAKNSFAPGLTRAEQTQGEDTATR